MKRIIVLFQESWRDRDGVNWKQYETDNDKYTIMTEMLNKKENIGGNDNKDITEGWKIGRNERIY